MTWAQIAKWNPVSAWGQSWERKMSLASLFQSQSTLESITLNELLVAISAELLNLSFSICLCCQVTLWNGDALALCTSGLPREMLFDVIDTSNVSDHIGLLNVLVCCAPRLKLYVKRNISCGCCNFLNTTRRLIALRVVERCVTWRTERKQW